MKKIILAISLLMLMGFSFGQSPLQLDKAQLNAGGGITDWGFPLYVGIDYCIYPDVTIGGETSFSTYDQSIDGTGYNNTIIGISGNGNYHFSSLINIPDNWDFYAGLTLGLYIWSTPAGYPGNHNTGLGIGVQAGGRYYFTNRFGLNVELEDGTALSGAKFGITYKL